jgi:hypothetical protein
VYKAGLEMKYKIGEITQTEDETPLFAFDTLDHADLYMSGRKLFVFECYYELYTKHNPYRIISGDMIDLDQQHSPKVFWSDPDEFLSKHYIDTQEVIYGTIFCKWLRPIRLIE